ncbi:diguanylate cyclase (GGDEF)-like protein/PAS domain S-box-containing protein [Salirhabdus euzebyi]|uniref:Diguanylate cyclase (GGDEF)-like protein/PAS domain S-box-containing protein n=1 Tax=Salirhabdus euzebyi TaxID=394506 RepID=A0A841Q8U9_9BACI|nr:EAL domain-containing protein [Salirhabdus euzebyi]MBB6454830.1 diguanylate cyclase (GGDEF)-like protein/PAS domain S-box-containing protein [Salirhabdus euzebyi]
MSMQSSEITLPVPEWFLKNIRDAALLVDVNGKITFANEHALKLLDLDSSNLALKSMKDFFDFGVITKQTEQQMLMELRIPKKQLVQIKSSLVKENTYCLLLHPVQLNEKKHSMLYSLSNMMNEPYEGMILHDAGVIVDCDNSFAQMLGYTKNELMHQSIFKLVDRNYIGVLKENMNKYHEGPYQLKGIKKTGETIYVEVLPQPYPDGNRVLRIAVVRDVTERVKNEKQIQFMAYYDELTDLPNRNFFNKTLKEAIDQCEKDQSKLAVHFVDIDYFKQINDTLGYQFGDGLLKACAERLKTFLNENNFIARMSGDEFLILQRNICSEKDAEQFAKHIIAAFQAPIDVDDFELYTSVSIGISIFPENGSNANELIKHADSAMYVIKNKQRNHYKLFESSISENFKEMLTIETELRRAIKHSQFELHYQPQINLVSNKVIGFEALLRWNHPEKGYISPNAFIPLAEKTGLIIEIGDWVLQEACRQNREWQIKGYAPLKVSVNLSVKQFLQKNLVKKVEQTLQQTGLEPQYLEVEITESMAMSNESYIMETLLGLKNLGVNVSIDDFGTGYSSMKYLSQFPLSKLKIDQLFIRGEREQNQAIVKSIIHMSHALNMKVIAEGVETKEQLEFLKNERCDEIQGFYFSKPVRAQDAELFFV